MDPHDPDAEEPQEIDLQSLKRALMRREEAVERFRAAKAKMLRGSRPDDARGQDQPPNAR